MLLLTLLLWLLLLTSADFDAIAGTHCPQIAVVDAAAVVVLRDGVAVEVVVGSAHRPPLQSIREQKDSFTKNTLRHSAFVVSLSYVTLL